MGLFTRKPKVTEQKLGDALFEVAWGRTKRYYEHAFESEENNNKIFLELLIFNMSLIVSFAHDKVSNNVMDIMYDRFIEALSELGLSNEAIDGLKKYNMKMLKWYQGIIKQYAVENYLQELSVQFLSHISDTKVSAYTMEAVEFTQDIAESIELIVKVTGNVKFK